MCIVAQTLMLSAAMGDASGRPAPSADQRTVWLTPSDRGFQLTRLGSHGGQPWWTRRSKETGWVYPRFPVACFDRDTAHGGVSASAWQVLWAYPHGEPDQLSVQRRNLRLTVRATQSIFAASAQRVLVDEQSLFTRSLAPRFVTTRTCRADIRSVAVPPEVFDRAGGPQGAWGGPYGAGTMTEWLLRQGFSAPNRKYVVLLQRPPAYLHEWFGISENAAAGAGWGGPSEDPTLANPANFTSFSYLDMAQVLQLGGSDRRRAARLGVSMAHEMTHAMGAMTASAPHRNLAPDSGGPLHPTDCWDLLCYGPMTPGETYTSACGRELVRTRVIHAARLDCGRDDYWAPATDTGLPEAPWANQRWAVHRSSFLYGNPQPSAELLEARRR